MFRGLTGIPKKQYYLHQRNYSIDVEKVKYMYVWIYLNVYLQFILWYNKIVSSIPEEFILIDEKLIMAEHIYSKTNSDQKFI